MIYLDACAIVKLVAVEPESAALAHWLRERADQKLVSSVLADVEVPRALRRGAPGMVVRVGPILARLVRVEIDTSIRATAAAYVEPHLRALGAIHLATAAHLGDSGLPITDFVTYDQRLADAAAEAGFSVVAPGA